MSYGINLLGIKEVKEALARKNKALTDGLDKEMTATALIINGKQKSYSPVRYGALRMANVVDVSRPLDKKLSNTKKYSPYMEWGTGGLVTVPVELAEIAIQYKGRGIRQVNIAAQSFFYRAYFEERGKFIERVKKLMAK